MVTVELEAFAYGGESIGRLEDGRAVFVPYSLPGEKVRIELVEDKKRFARGELIEVIDSSPRRIKPRCPYYSRCGGCHYQHIPYEDQLASKSEILRDTLQRIGKITAPQIEPLVPSSTPWNYRNHVQFHIAQNGQLGFQEPGGGSVIPVQECYLPVDPINQVWPLLDLETIPGIDRIGLRVGDYDEVMINLNSRDPEPVELMVDMPVSIVYTGPGGNIVLAGDDHISMTVLDRQFKISAGSFFQVNTLMASEMVQHILSTLSLTDKKILVDAYCGVGLFSAFLAPVVESIIGIETAPSACDDFVINLEEFDNVELYQAPVGNVLPSIDPNPDIMIVDPPRAGLDRWTIDGILNLKPEVLVYVSCDPATLSRDIHRLSKGGYMLNQITPFDLFPQTFHIESISILERKFLDK